MLVVFNSNSGQKIRFHLHSKIIMPCLHSVVAQKTKNKTIIAALKVDAAIIAYLRQYGYRFTGLKEAKNVSDIFRG